MVVGAESDDVANDGDADVIISVVVAETEHVCRRFIGRGESGSSLVMVGSRLLRVDTERTLSSHLSPGRLRSASLS